MALGLSARPHLPFTCEAFHTYTPNSAKQEVFNELSPLGIPFAHVIADCRTRICRGKFISLVRKHGWPMVCHETAEHYGRRSLEARPDIASGG